MATKATIVADCNPGEDIVVICLNAQGYRSVERKRLPLGDYQITYGDAMVLVERKTLDDWRSSMIDGRLDAQRARAEELFQETGVKLVYILEDGVADWSDEQLRREEQGPRCVHPEDEPSRWPPCHSVQDARLHRRGHWLHRGPTRMRRTQAQARLRGRWRARQAPSRRQSCAAASKLVAAIENEISDTKLKSGRRIGNAVAKRVKACFY